MTQVWKKEYCGEGLKGPRGRLGETILPLNCTRQTHLPLSVSHC